MKRLLIILFAVLAAAPTSTAQVVRPQGDQAKPPQTKPPTPEKKLPEKLECVFDRAWTCRHRGCLVDTRKVVVHIDTKTKIACQMRRGKCVRPMPFALTKQRRGFSGAITKRGMIFFIDDRYRATVAQLRRKRVFAVYGQCKPVAP